MKDFGYGIVKALITDIVPDNKVKSAMNDIDAAAREREATVKRLQGEGIANQRKAIIAGLSESLTTFSEAVTGAIATASRGDGAAAP